MISKSLPCLANSAMLVLSILFGTYALYMHNNLLPYFYFIFAVCVIISHKGYIEIDNDLMAAAWLLLAMFPVPFLLYYQDILLAVVYVALFWGWFMVNGSFDRDKHDTVWCLLSSRRHSLRIAMKEEK